VSKYMSMAQLSIARLTRRFVQHQRSIFTTQRKERLIRKGFPLQSHRLGAYRRPFQADRPRR